MTERDKEVIGGFATCHGPKYRDFIFRDDAADNFPDRFIHAGMMESTNMGLFTFF